MEYIAHIREKDNKEQSVLEHSRNVSEFCKQWGTLTGLSKCAELLGKLHDLGKTTQDFSNYIRDAVKNPKNSTRKGTIDHATAGAQYLYDTFYSGDIFDKFFVEIASIIICSHHGGLINYLDLECKSAFLERMHKNKDEIRYNEAINNYFLECYSEENIRENFIAAKAELYNLLNSQNPTKKIRNSLDISLLTKLLFSYVIDADRLDTYLFMEDKAEDNEIEINTLWKQLLDRMDEYLNHISIENTGIKIIELRRKISEECRAFAQKQSGIYSLTVPTGGGKTFSSFRYALAHAYLHKKERIIYIVPFTTIIDQNAADIRNIINDDNLLLEHHSNVVEDNEQEDYKLLTERWNAPIIFTTMVQFLNTLFKGGTQNVRRLHHLSNSVLIFDEVQAVPLKCIHLFNSSLNFLSKVCNSTIVLCTATQPALTETKRPLLKEAETEMITNLVSVFASFKRVEIIPKLKPGGYSYEELADMIFDEMRRVLSVLIILNTKKNVEKLYTIIENRNCSGQNPCKVFHLSTKICPAHRMDILKQIKDAFTKGEKIICISTQLIEAGVNISFECVFRALAGLESIAQAAGRCNRHSEKEMADTYIINLEDEDLSMLPDIKTGQATMDKILYEYKTDPKQFQGDLLSPEAIQRYFSYYYKEKEQHMDFPIVINNSISTDLYSLLNQNQKGEEYYYKKFGTPVELILKKAYKLAGDEFFVIPENTRSVIVPYKEGATIIADLNGSNINLSELNALLRKAQRFSVNLYPNEFEEIQRHEGLYSLNQGGLLALKEEFYNDNVGWEVEPKMMKFITG